MMTPTLKLDICVNFFEYRTTLDVLVQYQAQAYMKQVRI